MLRTHQGHVELRAGGEQLDSGGQAGVKEELKAAQCPDSLLAIMEELQQSSVHLTHGKQSPASSCFRPVLLRNTSTASPPWPWPSQIPVLSLHNKFPETSLTVLSISSLYSLPAMEPFPANCENSGL